MFWCCIYDPRMRISYNALLVEQKWKQQNKYNQNVLFKYLHLVGIYKSDYMLFSF